MGTSDPQTLKSEAEILARQARPQRSSTWMPKKRDWRYATGVIQQADFDDAPKSRTVWDTLDYYYQAGGDIEEQTRTGSTMRSERYISETFEAAHMPESTDVNIEMVSPKASLQVKPGYKSMTLREGSWKQVTRFTSVLEAEGYGGEVRYELTGRIVRFCFTTKNKAVLQEILNRPAVPTRTQDSSDYGNSPQSSQKLTPPVSSPITLATSRTAATIHAPHVLDSIESLYAYPLFKRAWIDETYDFDSTAILRKLRDPSTVVGDLGSNFGWYTDAVPVDAIFPPGVPISAKEIHAFYPHHVRWKGIMLRLTHNDYRGADIVGMQALFRGPPHFPTLPVHMNNYQRDIVKSSIRSFKTGVLAGKGDRNLRTSHLVSGPHIESVHKGYTLPTFAELVRGLRRMPAGLDARGLTQCLSWYVRVCDTFTPRLEMNVMHAQSLLRALREPLKLFGPQNLDRNALEEWQETGTFESVAIETSAPGEQIVAEKVETLRRSQLHLNLDNDGVALALALPVRHVLTFPFLALHGVVGQALRMGIERAEMRSKARREERSKNEMKRKWAAPAADLDADEEDDLPEPKKPYRIPKRERPPQMEDLPVAKKSVVYERREYGAEARRGGVEDDGRREHNAESRWGEA